MGFAWCGIVADQSGFQFIMLPSFTGCSKLEVLIQLWRCGSLMDRVGQLVRIFIELNLVLPGFTGFYLVFIECFQTYSSLWLFNGPFRWLGLRLYRVLPSFLSGRQERHLGRTRNPRRSNKRRAKKKNKANKTWPGCRIASRKIPWRWRHRSLAPKTCEKPTIFRLSRPASSFSQRFYWVFLPSFEVAIPYPKALTGFLPSWVQFWATLMPPLCFYWPFLDFTGFYRVLRSFKVRITYPKVFTMF